MTTWTPATLNLQSRMRWEVQLGNDATLCFTWNPRGSMVTVTLCHRTRAVGWWTDEVWELEGFTLNQAAPPSVDDVEQAIAGYVNDGWTVAAGE